MFPLYDPTTVRPGRAEDAESIRAIRNDAIGTKFGRRLDLTIMRLGLTP